MKKQVLAAAIAVAIREIRNDSNIREIKELAGYFSLMMNDIEEMKEKIDPDYTLFFKNKDGEASIGIFQGDDKIGYKPLVGCVQRKSSLSFERAGNNAFVWSPDNVYILFEEMLQLI